MKVCIYGGQYGSEGKGSVSEYYALNKRSADFLIAIGENAPNSGHTCSLGKTQNIPAASFFADAILLGPDSVINLETLKADLKQVYEKRGRMIELHIHEHACILIPHVDIPAENQVVADVSSTGSGSGHARISKYFYRYNFRTIAGYLKDQNKSLDEVFGEYPVRIVNRFQYMHLLQTNSKADWIFECSQGVLLDTNWGVYPFVTSRSTSPHVAIERNGLGAYPWEFIGVYRTFPIRTGGPSGPTGGRELSWEMLGQMMEIATVTRRVRRVFEFSREDYQLSIMLSRPDVVAFTHVDYLKVSVTSLDFRSWLEKTVGDFGKRAGYRVIASEKPGQFSTM